MSNKNCMVFETFHHVNEMQKTKKDGLMTLSGVFGECGVRNNNHRIYEKSNYGKMVNEMKQRIAKDGAVPGELEHPSSLNITLENISHKITDINIDENGLVTGTIQLLDTPKGKIAQAIVEGGLPLFISSRACGQVDKNGNVTLEKLATFDLVGAPGVSRARLYLNESQICESLSDNVYIISEKDSENNTKINSQKDNIMENPSELAQKLELLESRIAELENENNELHDQVDEALASKIDLKKLADGIQKWVVEEYSNNLQSWLTEEFGEHMIKENKRVFVREIAPKIQKWVVEEFSPEIENWVVEQYGPEVENWVIKEVAPGIQNWMCEHFAPEIENWLNECYMDNIKDVVNEGLKETKSGQLKSITDTLTMLEGLDIKKPNFGGNVINENRVDEPLYVANMPESARVKYNMASQEVKESIHRRAKIFDFTNEGAIERFWESINFEEIKPTPSIYEGLENISDLRERQIRAAFRRRRN